MAKQTLQSNPSNPSPTQDAHTLHDFFAEYKAHTQPSDELMDRIFADIPEAEGSKATWFSMFTSTSFFTFASAACALSLFWFVPMWSSKTKPAQTNIVAPRVQGLQGLTAKGAVSIQLLHARKTEFGFAHKQLTHDGTILSEGDLVQLQYNFKQKTHVMMLSANQKGELSVFVPLGKRHSVAVSPGKGHLPSTGSLELDDNKGEEVFFLLYAPKPFTLSQVKQALATSPSAKGPWNVRRIVVEKK